MHIAFYAPLKPPTHATPSGDRRMARLLMAALRRSGHRVELASRFRSYDRGDARRQKRLKEIGERLADRLIRRHHAAPAGERPDVWFTYHLYHKAPDWLGPRVSHALSIPYVVAEASHAPKRAEGAWKSGHDGAAAAITQADLIIGFNPEDAACLRPLLKTPDRQITLPPFIDTEPYLLARRDREPSRRALARRYGLDESVPWLLCAAMMRDDQKRRSYEVLANALEKIQTHPWRLLIAGSGPAEGRIKRTFAPLAGRVSWLGRQDEDALGVLYGASDIFVWPAIKEAYGMAFLEAQSAGLPVIAGRSAGVESIIRHGHGGLLTPQGDAEAFAAAAARLLDDASLRAEMAARAQANMLKSHSLEKMSAALDRLLRRSVVGRAA